MLKLSLPKIYNYISFKLLSLFLIITTIIAAVIAGVFYLADQSLRKSSQDLGKNLALIQQELTVLKNQDQVKINLELKLEIDNIHTSYMLAATLFEGINDLKSQGQKTGDLDQLYAETLKYLADRNYASASADLRKLDQQVKDMEGKLAPSTSTNTGSGQAAVPSATQSNNPPGSGYQRQTVQTDRGSFSVDIIAADLNSTKVIVDTASDSDCGNNCPALPLSTYATRSGAWAGINGSFFCPTAYPSCAGKTNSFDTLLMNKNKHYFNSDNNVYSTVPAAIFGPGSARFVGRSLEWGRDTSVDAVIANYPLYIAGGNINFGGNGDPKIDNKGTRSFVASKGKMVYFGIIWGASGADASQVLKTLGMDSALGLDQGGSTALWMGGRYLSGPGRDIPNAVLFVKR